MPIVLASKFMHIASPYIFNYSAALDVTNVSLYFHWPCFRYFDLWSKALCFKVLECIYRWNDYTCQCVSLFEVPWYIYRYTFFSAYNTYFFSAWFERKEYVHIHSNDKVRKTCPKILVIKHSNSRNETTKLDGMKYLGDWHSLHDWQRVKSHDTILQTDQTRIKVWATISMI